MSIELTARTLEAQTAASETASPRSIASLPSPPSSPKPHNHDENSIPGTPSSFASDLPISSLSSSLFLSGASSPGPHPPLHEEASSRTLIIPSLTIPQYDPARGDAVGSVKLWVIGAGLPDCQAAAESIVRDAPLISEIGDWIFNGNGVARLQASTVSSAHQSLPHSLHHNRWNVEVYVADVSVDSVAQVMILNTHYSHRSFDSTSQPASTVDSILVAIQEPFTCTDRLLNDSEPSTTSFLPLLTSSTTLLHTAVVYLRSSRELFKLCYQITNLTHVAPKASTRHDQVIINELSPYIPVITMPIPLPHPYGPVLSKASSSPESATTSTVRPKSLTQLRDNLFLNPSTLHHLRIEAAERFLRWRDLNAALRAPESPTVHPLDVVGSRELPNNASRPPAHGRVGSASSARPSSTIFRTQNMPQSVPAHTPLPGTVRSPLLDVEEEHVRDWMWNWESRFSRDVLEQQRRHPLSTVSSSSVVAGTSVTRVPLSVDTSGGAIAGPIRPSSAMQNGGRFRSPPIPHQPSPVRSTDCHGDRGGEPGRHERDDPLHLRSVARIAASILPALLRRYRILRPRARRRERRQERERREESMSWCMFGFGVSVGVVLSICIVGIGMELSNRIWTKD